MSVQQAILRESQERLMCEELCTCGEEHGNSERIETGDSSPSNQLGWYIPLSVLYVLAAGLWLSGCAFVLSAITSPPPVQGLEQPEFTYSE
jgi:hypothetical protein